MMEIRTLGEPWELDDLRVLVAEHPWPICWRDRANGYYLGLGPTHHLHYLGVGEHRIVFWRWRSDDDGQDHRKWDELKCWDGLANRREGIVLAESRVLAELDVTLKEVLL